MIIPYLPASLKYHNVDIWYLPLIFGDLVWEKSAHNIIYTGQYNLKNSFAHLSRPSCLTLCVAYPENPCRDSL